jgi:hypothetical protein
MALKHIEEYVKSETLIFSLPNLKCTTLLSLLPLSCISPKFSIVIPSHLHLTCDTEIPLVLRCFPLNNEQKIYPANTCRPKKGEWGMLVNVYFRVPDKK